MKRRGFFQNGTGERRVRFFIIIIFFFSLEQVTFWDLEDEEGELTNLGGGQERKVFFFFFPSLEQRAFSSLTGRVGYTEKERIYRGLRGEL